METVLFLKPGDLWFGPRAEQIQELRTVLGSCVAVTLWHRRLRLGGMCHFVLPSRDRPQAAQDGRYGDEAIGMLLGRATRSGAAPADCAIGVFGGAHMFPGDPRATIDIGANNAERALTELESAGLRPGAVDLRGHEHRQLRLDLTSGTVQVRRGARDPRAWGQP
jgi:chemotaxis protein CheD